MMTVLRLYWEFFKTGLFAVGGGLATLPFLIEMSEKTGWFTSADIADMIAISESTPGPLGINMGTYVGYKTVGMFGGLVSTLGIITPAIVIIILISKALQKFKNSPVVEKVFYGLRPASTGLIAAAGLGVAKIAMLNIPLFEQSGQILDLFRFKLIALGALMYFLLVKFKKHPIIYIAAAAVIGIVFKL